MSAFTNTVYVLLTYHCVTNIIRIDEKGDGVTPDSAFRIGTVITSNEVSQLLSNPSTNVVSIITNWTRLEVKQTPLKPNRGMVESQPGITNFPPMPDEIPRRIQSTNANK